LQRFYSVLQDYITQAKGGSLLHFKHVDVQSLIALSKDERKEVIAVTMQQIAKTKLNAVGELISRVLDNAEGILLGTTSTIEILIRENALTEVYNTIGGMIDCGGFFAAVGHSKPNIRVLEIGAGTGGTSAIALRNLISSYGEPMYSVYSFTDISPGFFPTAKERFAQYQNVQYQVLDITRDPIEQGFEAGYYDLIIAANVLHATPHLLTTLGHVRKLLHPKGRLFLQELNPGAVQYVDLIMGGLRDWWLGAGDRRIDRPYINVDRWDEELRKAGFAGIEGVVYDDKEPNVLQNIVARPQREVKEYRHVTLLLGLNQTGGSASLVEGYLLAQGFTVHKRTLYDDLPPYQNIISLIDLERPLLASISPEEFNLLMTLLPKLESAGILWVMRSAQIGCTDPNQALILGLARTIRSEMSITFTTLELDDIHETGCLAVVNVFRKFQDREDSIALDVEREYALVKGIVNVSRYHWVYLPEEIAISAPESSSLHLRTGRLGQFSSLQWQVQPAAEIGADEVIVAIDAVAIHLQVS
jgi:SAM-dependent methyltransferase